jgi:dTDP-4-amino-4,6-dideoxygalactose transaminase
MNRPESPSPPVPFLDLPAQHTPLRPAILAAVGRIVESGRFVLGEEVERFEKEAAAYLGVREAIGVASGTDALWLALAAAGIGPGDEVITPAYSFFAIAEAIERTGAVPVFVDVDEETLNATAEGVAAAMTPKTKAVVPVHLYGLPAPIAAIREAFGARPIRIVEDGAQAFGASAGGIRVGALGDLAAFSFYPTKNLAACGDGGLVTTDDEELARTIRVLRDHGQTGKYRHDLFGWNSRLDAVQAAILSIKLPLLDAWNARRREIARLYRERFRGLPLRLPPDPPGDVAVFHQFAIRSAERNRLRDHLAERRIATSVHYPAALHEQPVFRGRPGSFPVAERAAREVLCLPIYPELSDADARRVADAVAEWAARGPAAPGA